MMFNTTIYVTLKKGYSDPEGETALSALRGLGFKVSDVRSSKAYEISFDAEDAEEAKRVIDEMCRRLLTNPTKDDYRYDLRY